MKVNKIDHICIAVKDLEAAKKVWEPILGKGPDDPYVDELGTGWEKLDLN
jgi:methylmalonyl-CoA/ethylmalonyl-CoA epimerase